MQRIGMLGGTFDPIHLGHLIPAAYAFNHLYLDRLLLVPAAAPVHRPGHMPAPAADRLHMCRLAAASLPGLEASDIETRRAEPSYTVLTLRDLRDSVGPEAELVLLMGEDNLSTLHTWRDIGEIFRLATVAVLPRPPIGEVDLAPLRRAVGADAVDRLLARIVPAPRVPIKATEIRRRVAAGEPIDGLVPASVAAYIAERGLYRDPQSGAGRQGRCGC
ncbi:MAG: nicotinate (nicotinamide) nucleotide adenylyltransferase [Planctomycetes bacterium]|nr:nicotinate (nicotinamide) nucleotide adenylyltransferase [Planctomycetota bacterium]